MKLILAILLLAASLGRAASSPVVIRVGYLTNLTHAQALLGRHEGSFQKGLKEATIEWKAFNAGPSVIEALFAGELDFAYIGPNPALNGYLKSGGQALKVLAPSASGGAALVVQPDIKFTGPSTFKGLRVATPQLGNTQDVAARQWFLEAGLKPNQDVLITPMANADQLLLFQKKSLSASWTVEPWVSRLVEEAGGKVALEEKKLWPKGQYLTTVLIGRQGFLKDHADLTGRFVGVHADLTRWIRKNSDKARRLVNEELGAETGKPLAPKVLKSAWKRLEFTVDADPGLLILAGKAAVKLGFLKEPLPKTEEIFDLSALKAWRRAGGK